MRGKSTAHGEEEGEGFESWRRQEKDRRQADRQMWRMRGVRHFPAPRAMRTAKVLQVKNAASPYMRLVVSSLDVKFESVLYLDLAEMALWISAAFLITSAAPTRLQ